MLLSWFINPNFIKETCSIYNFVSRKNERNPEANARNQRQKLYVYTAKAKTAILNTTRSAIFCECYSSWNKIKFHVAWIAKLCIKKLTEMETKRERV